MRRFVIAVAVVAVCVAMSGCGTPMPGKYSIGEEYSPTPLQSGKATIYVFHRMSAIAAPCFVHENGVKVGVIKSGTYFARHVAPGEYEYLVINDSHIKAPIRIKAEDKKEYFIEVTQQPDFLMAHPYMNIVGREQAEAILPTLKRIAYLP